MLIQSDRIAEVTHKHARTFFFVVIDISIVNVVVII